MTLEKKQKNEKRYKWRNPQESVKLAMTSIKRKPESNPDITIKI